MFSTTRNILNYAKKHYDAISESRIDQQIDHFTICTVVLLAVPFTVSYDIGVTLGEECMRSTPDETIKEEKPHALLQSPLRRSARLAEKARSKLQ